MSKFKINIRNSIVLTHDLLAIIFAWVASYLLRFNFAIPSEHIEFMLNNLVFVLLIHISFFLFFRVFLASWRFSSLNDLVNISFSIAISGLFLVVFFSISYGFLGIPRSILILNPLLLILLMGGSRLLYRALNENTFWNNKKVNNNVKNVVILGSGKEAISLIKSLKSNTQWNIIGLFGDDETLNGREVSGIKMFGFVENLSNIHKKKNIDSAIIAMPSADYKDRRFALQLANSLGIEVLTIPGIDDLMSGRLNVSQVRRVDVEDLLGRDKIKLNNSGLNKLLNKKVVLVSGAGGSIGNELCRQLIKFKPKTIVCLDISEYALYSLEQSLTNEKIKSKLIYIVADIKNEERINKIIKRFSPASVFHAAAYKHVPLMEKENVSEALLNNSLGTYVLANICQKLKVKKFVLISTDKAINPTNVMGASKRLAEIFCKKLQNKNGTQFITVRFGNVLGSSGSVIPLFKEQIENGGPITVTDPRITRYFMAIPEAAQLVLQASLIGDGGDIFVLEMGKPIRILDLAKDMISLSGLQEDEIDIKFTGLRLGEKLYEELLADNEKTKPTSHTKIRIANTINQNEKLSIINLIKWIKSTKNLNEKLIKKELSRWVKEYQPDDR
jgi:FlaA1/EpsC-like NDP-sugar epimerase